MGLRKDGRAFSSVLDALLFLSLVSISGVIIFSAVGQQTTVIQDRSREIQAQALVISLLNAKVDDFDYGMNITEGGFAENITEKVFNLLFGRESKHLTYADLIADYLALDVYSSGNEAVKADYRQHLDILLDDYLRSQANHTHFELEVSWSPYGNSSISSGYRIGDEEPPPQVYSATTYISMPYHGISRDILDVDINTHSDIHAVILNASSKSGLEAGIAGLYDPQIERVARDFSDDFVNITFNQSMGELLDEFEEVSGDDNTSLGAMVVDGLSDRQAVKDTVEAEVKREIAQIYLEKVEFVLSEVRKLSLENGRHIALANLDEFPGAFNSSLDDFYYGVNIGRARCTLRVWG